MISVAMVSHNSIGRLRVKVPSRKKDINYFFSAKEKLLNLTGVSSVDINPLTGSILILHELEQSLILKFAEDENLFIGEVEHCSQPSNFHDNISIAFAACNEKIKENSKGTINMGGLLTLLLVGAGAYQIYKGNFEMLSWSGAFWYAYNIFLKTHE
ncbi:MAG: hypothetical protein HQK79_01650 [Desulfobacterales bacterium]|nr:hypothetical protein [Desulfobacterales bacterium]MBF0398193.1 hypothetical protein [Desulfobacterales bacterium]